MSVICIILAQGAKIIQILNSSPKTELRPLFVPTHQIMLVLVIEGFKRPFSRFEGVLNLLSSRAQLCGFQIGEVAQNVF
jgi:hypothetical protein